MGDDLAKKLNEMYKKIAEQEDTYAKLQNDLDDAREALMASRTEAFRLHNDLAEQKEGEQFTPRRLAAGFSLGFR
jgi:predicted  nucleic acid-binding Zn-ribbon protein